MLMDGVGGCIDSWKWNQLCDDNPDPDLLGTAPTLRIVLVSLFLFVLYILFQFSTLLNAIWKISVCAVSFWPA